MRERLRAWVSAHHPASSTPAPPPAPAEARPDLVLVACSDKKADTGGELAPASQVYTSPLFRLSLEYARTLVPDDRIRIVSAKHHVLAVDEPIASYDLPLASLSLREREAWGGRVVHILRGEIGPGPHAIAILGGEDYVRAIRSGAVGLGWTFVLPFGSARGERMPIGKRLQWLARQIDGAGARHSSPAADEHARVVAFIRARADEERQRCPARQRRKAPMPAEIAEHLEDAAAFVQRRRLDVHAAIAHVRALADNAGPFVATPLYHVAKGLERGKHRGGAAG
jgi:hypothetical protein